jgi:hypothetical protein
MRPGGGVRKDGQSLMATKAALVCASLLSARGTVLLVELAVMFLYADCAKSARDAIWELPASHQLAVTLDIAI